jgi:hypothetical protein
MVNLLFINLLKLRSHMFGFIEKNNSVTVTVTGTLHGASAPLAGIECAVIEFPFRFLNSLNDFLTTFLTASLPYSSTFPVKTDNAPSASRVLRASARINEQLLLRR